MAAGLLGDDLEDCDDCSARGYRLGLQVDYAFKTASAMRPWIGAGIGYEWLSISEDTDGGDVTLSFSGFEFVNLQGGLDWRIGDSKFSIGPFAMLSIGQYSNASIDTPLGDDEEGIEDKKMHQWFQIGVRGRFDL